MVRRKREPLSKEKLEAKKRYDDAVKEATEKILLPNGEFLDVDEATKVMDEAFEKHGFPEAFREKVSPSTAESIITLTKARRARREKKLKQEQEKLNEGR